MKLSEMAKRLRLRNLTPDIPGEGDAVAVYGHSTDLFSDVLANAPRGSVLVTLHVQMNVLAVAIPAEVMAVIFAWNRVPNEAVVKKAAEEGIWLYVADDSTFNIVGQLYALGLRG
ncbi:serine kinase [Planctomycetota bacterium]